MKGLARTLFEELSGHPLDSTLSINFWPLLERACRIGCLSYVDLFMAEHLLGGRTADNQLQGAFLCHLSKAVREGHLCIRKEGGEVYPSPHNLWLSDINEEDPGPIVSLLDDLCASSVDLPDHLVSLVHDGDVPLKPLCRFGELYYFQKYWLFETSFADTLKTLLKQSPQLSLDDEYVANTVAEMLQSNRLNQEQAQAILKSCGSCFSIICGGPGTGKTYTAGHLIKIFWNALHQEQKENCEIALAAPTGKAANNLQKSLEKAFSDMPDAIEAMQARTLHSLLGVRVTARMKQKAGKKLSADLILVDESSMIDVRLISYLLDSVKPGSRLILLGDPYQLPPVEVGSVFNDVIRTLPAGNVFELKTCLRAELKEIVEFSRMVKDGDVQGVLSQLDSESGNPAVSRVSSPSGAASVPERDALLEYAHQHFPGVVFSESQDPLDLLESFNRFRLLSPLRKGPFGVVEINRHIHQSRIAQVAREDYLVAPIIIVTNDYRMNLFNGEVGVLVSRRSRKTVFQEGDFALFDGGRSIPAVLLPKFEYSYCLSVHKSQGSEFGHVLLLLPEGSERFGREVLYTAVTRAKRKLEVWGSDATLQKTVSTQSDRLSGIGHHPWHT